ncbi:hypothetical protein [Streptomyces boncukensis]|uniref:Transposase (putative) YhgA-like domain-containing protein n=1 Tax=Streptomyces boncukensis TaxID=2711219 RepID=A0A6G4X1W8_9ACTN|nr:hypothetical protein [Streptomyces boncukensis]NGO70744.1 hypothetical protein [Streptomyces boncukensis]
MVKSPHEARHHVIREFPEILERAFSILDLPSTGSTDIEFPSCDLTEIRPVERRVDTLVRISCRDSGRKYLVLAESQSGKDEDKGRSWAYYLSYLANRYPNEHPLLLVMCDQERVAKWAMGPFHIGHGSRPNLTVTPFVTWPGNIPEVTDQERAAEDLPFAVFSVMTHVHGPRIGDILKTFAYALRKAEDPTIYADLVASAVAGTAAAEHWENLMAAGIFELNGPVAEGLREAGREAGREEGEVKRAAQCLLQALQKRGLRLTAEQSTRISDCHDLELLDRWFDRSLTATSVSEVFREDGEDSGHTAADSAEAP